MLKIDRSNGFEKDYFLRQNARSARDAEAHAWSVEDMWTVCHFFIVKVGLL